MACSFIFEEPAGILVPVLKRNVDGTGLKKVYSTNEMGGACGTYGGRKRCVQGFGWGNLRERDHWGDQGVDGRIILRWIFRKREGVVGSWLRIGTGGGRL